jgi:lipopolysaccharide transport system permease protein
MKKDNDWDFIIRPTSGLFELHLKEIWRYKDLLMLFVKRDIVAIYKQTILGPIWFILQPLITSLTFTIIFGNIAGISTDGKPQILFYLAGTVCWNYFADCLNATSSTFITNYSIFGKVYFPRLISPIAMVISNLVKFAMQFVLFLCIYSYFAIFTNADVHITPYVLLVPVLVMIMAFLGMGIGLAISAFTTKYRDLRFLIAFGMQLMMYATPIIYPLSVLKGKMHTVSLFNPMTSVIETFKLAFFGGDAPVMWGGLLYAFLIASFMLSISVIIFNRVEKSFMDTF